MHSSHCWLQMNNEGMAAALRFFRAIAPYAAPDPQCTGANTAFQQGRCLMTINWADEFPGSPQNASSASTIGITQVCALHVLTAHAVHALWVQACCRQMLLSQVHDPGS